MPFTVYPSSSEGIAQFTVCMGVGNISNRFYTWFILNSKSRFSPYPSKNFSLGYLCICTILYIMYVGKSFKIKFVLILKYDPHISGISFLYIFHKQ
jgi:hypothetical protein